MADEETTQGQGDERDEAEAMARLRDEINNLPVSEHLIYMLHSLSSLAADRLGLVGDSAGRRDPAQARLAIDAFKAMLGVLEQERPAAEITAYRGMLSQLQMAYVEALSAGPAPAAESPAPGPEPKAMPEPAPEPAPAPKAAAKRAAPKAAPKKAAKPPAGGAK
jgi:hypothetical protein